LNTRRKAYFSSGVSAKGEVESEQYGAFARFVIADENVQFVIKLKFEIFEALKV
jgi:hypothetical protein